MKTTHKSWLWLAASLAAFPAAARVEPLKSADVRAYFVEPLTNRTDPDQGWIAVRTVKDGREIARIPIGELKGIGPARTQPGAGAALELRISPSKTAITVATAKVQEGWYAPAELCGGNAAEADCAYGLFRDTDAQTIILRLSSGKR